MNLEKELIKITKKIEGSLVGIDIHNKKVLDSIQSNKKIENNYQFDFGSRSLNKIKNRNNSKKYNIKKIRKYFKKKSINYFICDIVHLKKYFNAFIKNNINITNKKIYLYGKLDDYDINELVYRYKRYGAIIKIKKNEKEFLIEITIKDIKARFFKNVRYRIRDNIYNLSEFISLILIN